MYVYYLPSQLLRFSRNESVNRTDVDAKNAFLWENLKHGCRNIFFEKKHDIPRGTRPLFRRKTEFFTHFSKTSVKANTSSTSSAVPMI